ncbi:MAG: hypothetical protein AAGI66_09105 [Cyanobacteria bacterium P01_H01_bin.74]
MKKYCFETASSLTGVKIALTLAVVSLSTLSYAENHRLQGISFFQTTPDKTEIRLESGSILPIKTVQASVNQIVIELDQIIIDETVKTDFLHNSTISHVVLKPVSKNRARLTIRGKDLGKPSISFADYQPDQASNDAMLTGRHQIIEDIAPPTVFGTKPNRSEASRLTRPTLTGPDSIQPAVSQIATERSPDNSLGQPAVNKNSSSWLTGLKQQEVSIEDKTVPNLSTKSSRASLTIAQAANSMVSVSGTAVRTLVEKYNQLIKPYAPEIGWASLVVLLFGIAMGVVRKRLLTRKQRIRDVFFDEVDTDDFLTQASVRFRQAARQYREKHGFTGNPNYEHLDQAEPLDMQTNQRSNSAIGLNGLGLTNKSPNKRGQFSSQADVPSPLQRQPEKFEVPHKKMDNPLMDLVAEIQAKNNQTQSKKPPSSLPVKQAAKQYQTNGLFIKNSVESKQKSGRQTPFALNKNVQPKPSPDNKQPTNRALLGKQKQSKTISKPTFNSVPAGQAIQRTSPDQNGKPFYQAETTMPSKTKLAKPQRAGQPQVGQKDGTLPDNPEVLNFLRNVAELMEGDGNKTMANSIYKNIGSVR